MILNNNNKKSNKKIPRHPSHFSFIHCRSIRLEKHHHHHEHDHYYHDGHTHTHKNQCVSNKNDYLSRMHPAVSISFIHQKWTIFFLSLDITNTIVYGVPTDRQLSSSWMMFISTLHGGRGGGGESGNNTFSFSYSLC